MLSPSLDCVETVAGVFGWHRGEAEEVHSSDELSEHLEAIQDPLLPQARSPSAAVLIISSGSRAGMLLPLDQQNLIASWQRTLQHFLLPPK